jgi:hypothetical protein
LKESEQSIHRQGSLAVTPCIRMGKKNKLNDTKEELFDNDDKVNI